MNKSNKILITGALGFIGSSLLQHFHRLGHQVFGISTGEQSNFFRIPPDLQSHIYLGKISEYLSTTPPPFFDVIIHAASHGNYSWQNDTQKMIRGIEDLVSILEFARTQNTKVISLGSSSEYGSPIDFKDETFNPFHVELKSLYAISKVSQSLVIQFYSNQHKVPCVHLRLFSIYGPLEHPDRLIPTLCKAIITEKPMILSNPETERDFVYIQDLTEAVGLVHTLMRTNHFGKSFNICSGQSTKLKDIAHIATKICPNLQMTWDKTKSRDWDLTKWRGNPELMYQEFGWKAKTSFIEGLNRTLEFYKPLRKWSLESQYYSFHCDLSIVMTCYNHSDEIKQLLSEIANSLSDTNIHFEVLIVDDCDPTLSFYHLKTELSRFPFITLIRNLENQGSQYSLLRGLQLSRGRAIVTMDGDGQDPASSIKQLIQEWQRGTKLVVAKRMDRIESYWIKLSRKIFYRLWKIISVQYVSIDAGDFCLIDRSLIESVIVSPPDYFTWRGLRTSLTENVTYLSYIRPQSMKNKTTNSVFSLVRWGLRFMISTSNHLGLYLIVLSWIVLIALGAASLLIYLIFLHLLLICFLLIHLDLKHRAKNQKTFQENLKIANRTNPDVVIHRSFISAREAHDT